MNNRRAVLLFLVCMTLSLLTACFSPGKEFRPDQVIENALKSDETVSYYAESETVVLENKEEHTTSTSKEWVHKEGKQRVESFEENQVNLIITNNKQNVQIYNSETNELMEGEIGDLEEVAYSPKEEMHMLIDGIQETHTVEYVGEEEIIGRKTHHLKATPRDETSLNGVQEYWFDAEYWIGLKTVSTFGDSTSTTTYTHFETKQSIDEELFSIEETSDMEVIDLDDFSQEHEITLDEMTDRLTNPIWYISENDTVQIDFIEVLAFEEEEDEYYTVEYTKDGLPFASLIIDSNSKIIHYDEDPEELQANDQTIYHNASLDQDIYVWKQDEVLYELWMNDPSISQEEVIQLIKGMEQL